MLEPRVPSTHTRNPVLTQPAPSPKHLPVKVKFKLLSVPFDKPLEQNARHSSRPPKQNQKYATFVHALTQQI